MVHEEPCRGSIVVVDDDPVLRQLLDDMLRSEGYCTTLVADGAEVGTAVRDTNPDLIILDLWLERPDSGWQILRALHNNLATRNLPVILYSAHIVTLSELKSTYPEAQYAFITKPFDTDKLLALVQQLLQQSSATRNKRK